MMCHLHMEGSHGGTCVVPIPRNEAYRIIGMPYKSSRDINDVSGDPWKITRDGNDLEIIEWTRPGMDNHVKYLAQFDETVDDLNRQICEIDGLEP